MSIILANNAKSTLAAAIGALDTTLTVTSGTETLFPSPTGGDYFYVTLEDSTKTVREIVKCTARSTTTLTIVRAQDGTSANIFALGSTVEMRVNKAALSDTISAATTAASNAATSASAAATSASSASTSAGTATTQAGIATTQATNASNSATSAASSASAAAASAASGMYSAVQDKNTNYTVVAADAGDLIRVTTTSGAITITLPLISGTGIGDGFKIAVVKWTADSNVVNIVRSGSDTINGATSAQIGSQYSQIVFVADLETSQWFASQSGLGATNINVDTFSGNGSTTAFTLTSDPSTKNNTAVYVTGVYQQKSTYSVSGTTLTFTTAPPTGTSNIEVAYSTPLAIGTPSDGTVTTAKLASTTGSGAVVLATSPTITTPTLTTPTLTSPIITGSTPQITVYTSGSGTYTVPTNARYLQVRMVGGGGGGSGGGNGGGNGGAGGNTTFGTSLLSAGGGSGGVDNTNVGASGGTSSIGSASGIALTGGTGDSGSTSSASSGYTHGGAGGASAFGGNGSGSGSTNVGAAGAGVTNTGGGGGGGQGGNPNGFPGSGGGAGGYVDAYITSPSASYSYAVGAGGTAGTAGTSGTAGGAGGSGVIYITAFF